MSSNTIQLRQIKQHLEKNYFEHIELNESEKQSSEDDILNYKLTRSLVGLAIRSNSDLDPKDTCKYITDGYNDCGIDGIYYNNNDNILYFIQSKYHKKGSGTIKSGDIHKFIQGVKNFIIPNFEDFNTRIKNRKDEINSYFLNTDTRFVLLLVYTGLKDISENEKKIIDAFLEEQNEAIQYFSFNCMKLNDIYNHISNGANQTPINSDLMIFNWNKVSKPINSYYGLISGSDLAQLVEKHGRKLFAPNIRVYLGRTEANDGIIHTVTNTPDKFWYYNNGITALCDEIKKKPIGGNNSASGIFECKNLRIVNGAQTVGSLHSVSKEYSSMVDKTKVMIRIFEVDKSNTTEHKTITRTNNTQNRIDSRDFISLDPEQKRIQDELRIDGVNYFFRSGEFVEPNQNGFDVVIAAIARACNQDSIKLTVQAKREVSKLWQNTDKKPYKTLFNKDIAGETIHKEVVILRQIDRLINNKKDELKKKKKSDTDSKEHLYVTHANRLIAHFIFKVLKRDKLTYNNPDDTIIKKYFDACYSLLYKKILELYPDSSLGSLVKNGRKCEEIDSKIDLSKIILVFKS